MIGESVSNNILSELLARDQYACCTKCDRISTVKDDTMKSRLKMIIAANSNEGTRTDQTAQVPTSSNATDILQLASDLELFEAKYSHILGRTLIAGFDLAQFQDSTHSTDHSAKDHRFPIQKR